MRTRMLGLCIGFMLISCSGTAVTLATKPIDGIWIGYSDGMGSTLTLVLKSNASQVSGTGSYTVGPQHKGSVAVSGSHQAPKVRLTLSYDHGRVLMLDATLVDDEHMKGSLTDKDGSVVAIEFARP